MSSVFLRYGKTRVSFEYEAGRFEILSGSSPDSPLTDIEIGRKLDDPVDSSAVEEIVSPGESVLIVVPDATRQTASGQIVNLLVRRLIANGTAPFDISVIFATGIHRSVTKAERDSILTPFIAQRVKALDHNPRDLAAIVKLGEIQGGLPIELNRALTENDHVILVGGVTFHYFAGFTGGRKLICPGLASSRTINATHKLAFDCETRSRRSGVGPGRLEGNAVHEAFTKAVSSAIEPSFAINTIVNDNGEAVDLFAGNWKTSHLKACKAYAATHIVEVDEKRNLVIVSCGGYPFDINMIQAHKALDAAARACEDGGTIVLLAECSDGLGRADFLNWFDAKDSGELAERLCERYQVNGQTAWSLLEKTERFDVRVVTSLDHITARKMRMRKIEEISDLAGSGGYIIPDGAKYLVGDREL
jgi:nickel-dependent lactate racemase